MSDTPRTPLLEQHVLDRLARCQSTDDPVGEDICEAAIIGLRWNKNSSLKEWFPFTAEKIIVLERELAAALADAERLDWMALQDYNFLSVSLIVDAPNDGKVSLMYTDDKHNERCVYGKDLRAAIDAAMKKERGK